MAKGVDDTDAVNVAQLKDVERKITNIDSNVINQARLYTDGQVAKVGGWRSGTSRTTSTRL